jgi:DNA-binding response OmpR family regulator
VTLINRSLPRGSLLVVERFMLVLERSSTSGLVARGLAEAGLEPDLIDNAPDALRACRAYAYAGALLDLESGGIELCRALRAAGFVAPIVMLAPHRSADRRRLALDVGADDVFTSPFSLAELVARLRALASRPHRRG